MRPRGDGDGPAVRRPRPDLGAGGRRRRDTGVPRDWRRWSSSGSARLQYHLRPALVSRADLRGFLGVSAYMFFISSSDVLISSLDRTVLAAFRPAATVGLYEGAVRLNNLVRAFTGSLSVTLLPVSSRLAAEGDRSRERELLVRGTRYMLAAVVPPTVTLMVLADRLLAAWLGSEVRCRRPGGGHLPGLVARGAEQLGGKHADDRRLALQPARAVLLDDRDREPCGVAGADPAAGAEGRRRRDHDRVPVRCSRSSCATRCDATNCRRRLHPRRLAARPTGWEPCWRSGCFARAPGPVAQQPAHGAGRSPSAASCCPGRGSTRSCCPRRSGRCSGGWCGAEPNAWRTRAPATGPRTAQGAETAYEIRM